MKKEKIKKESNFKKKIKELKSTARGRAILKLIGWIIFFILLFIISIISSTLVPKKEKIPTLETKQEEKITIYDSLKSLFTKNYEYTYDIKISIDNVNEQIIFNGKMINQIEEGYKETKSGIIKYKIDTTGTHEIKGSDIISIDNLYENINEKYIIPSLLLKNLLSLKYTNNNDVYSNVSNNTKYYITMKDNKITKIVIDDGFNKYSLSYKEVNN